MSLSPVSLQRLSQAHPKLQEIFKKVAETTPVMILEVYRDKMDQDAAVARGASRDPWPTSRHNTLPAEAVDAALIPIDWDKISDFEKLWGLVQAAAQELGYTVEWGGDFPHLKDYDHFQLPKGAA